MGPSIPARPCTHTRNQWWTTGPAKDPIILRQLLDLSADVIVLYDFTSPVVYINAAGLDFFGLDALPDVPMMVQELFTASGVSIGLNIAHALTVEGRWHGHSEAIHARTGARTPVDTCNHVLSRVDGAPHLIGSIIRDRTAHHDRDSELVHAGTAAALRAAAGQTALARLSSLAVSADLKSLMTAATTTAATMFGVESAAIARCVDPARTDLSIEAVSRDFRSDVEVSAGTGSLSGFALARAEPVVCSDIADEDRFDTSAMAAMGFRSGAAVPLATGTDVWGVLIVFGTRTRHFGTGEVAFLSAIAGVLCSRVALDQRHRRHNTHDALTGLPNSTRAYSEIGDALTRSRGRSGLVAVFLLNVDDFRIINDSLGHDAGDRALARFARRLTTATRAEDFVYRLGGDEFLIVCDAVEGIAHAERLAMSVSAALASSVDLVDGPTPVSVSIGIALSNPDSTVRDLLRRADLAMYRAKETGAGGYAVFESSDLYDADRIRSLSIDLRVALARDALTLVYQPLVDTRTDKIVAVEALARWTHPQLGPVGPAEFVAVAERSGQAAALGDWALRTACRQAASWREHHDIAVRVNVSALQLRDSSFPNRVAAILRDTGLSADALGLEITETVWLSDSGRVSDNLTAIHTMGVALLLDDVGKGHSSLSYLEQFSVFSSFKIDKSYVAGLPAPRARAIVAAMIALAKAYKVTVVGEGVETREQFDALGDAGCDLAQGYFLGRPADPTSITDLLGVRDH
ncbi:putative bifunctional diguanylate cyclase/phosphodiesterase [Rhodococcus sp. NBC_00294]|uniref:putative bifunctional diguanylate cyclase/phosphodiesterase n=1 Tax=Rhodococcus sp. NBC_00294 TaxID=2976004 RepID=UPI002E29BFCA|nr:GGDEF domain-containing protein [Rhodococcus sp. NBC_00294]